VDDMGSKNKGMGKAYQIAQELMKDRLKSVNPEAYEELKDVSAADVLVVPGQYDHIEDVLRLAGTRFTLVAPGQFDRITLRPDQILFINCPWQSYHRGTAETRVIRFNGGLPVHDRLGPEARPGACVPGVSQVQPESDGRRGGEG